MPHLQGPEVHQQDDVVWALSDQPEPNPYQIEWDDLIDAIRKDKPYNEVKRGAEASLVTSMGRMAAHTGQVDHLRRDAQLRARVRAGRGQADDGGPPRCCQQGRQVSGASGRVTKYEYEPIKV